MGPGAAGPTFTLVMDPPGGDVMIMATLTQDTAVGIDRAERFFGAPFPRTVRVIVHGDRARLDAHWRAQWHEPAFTSECWMVGMGLADELSLLSPARWRDQACEHDPDDAAAIARLVAHELVHTYHQQRNATIADDDAAGEALAWFVEGVATYVSGQLDDGHLAPAADAIRDGAAPTRLADAYRGTYRYGVSGSLVAFLDATLGRAALVRMLSATTPTELLAIAGMDEPTLLARWLAWALSRP